jgi:hypothetical protein
MDCAIVLIIIAIVAYFLFQSKEGFQNYDATGKGGSKHIEFCQTQCQSNRPWLIWWWQNWAKKGQDTAANCILDCQNIMVENPNQMMYFTKGDVYNMYGYTPSSP